MTARRRGALAGLLFTVLLALQGQAPPVPADGSAPRLVKLPAPAVDGGLPIEKALKERRSVREFSDTPVTLAELSQLCWSLQGVTDAEGHRTAPSAMASYPLKVYVVAGNVAGLPSGLYRYVPEGHALKVLALGDRRQALVAQAVQQNWVVEAPVLFLVVGVRHRIAKGSGPKGGHFLWAEAGLAAENCLLQAVSLDLGGTFVGGFNGDALKSLLGLPQAEEPLCLLPVGRRRAVSGGAAHPVP